MRTLNPSLSRIEKGKGIGMTIVHTGRSYVKGFGVSGSVFVARRIAPHTSRLYVKGSGGLGVWGVSNRRATFSPHQSFVRQGVWGSRGVSNGCAKNYSPHVKGSRGLGSHSG
jgi:hypothetical protein